MDLFVNEDKPFLFKISEWDLIFKNNKLDPDTYTNVMAKALSPAVNGCVLCFKRNYVGIHNVKMDAYCKHIKRKLVMKP